MMVWPAAACAAALIVGAAPTTITARLQAPGGAVRAEPYIWRSVAIKGDGFIDGIVFGKSRAGVLYVHTDMGGAYRYDAGKKRWTCLTDFIAYNDPGLSSDGVETLAADPTDPDRVYMAVGTYMQGSAIFPSHDGGRSWGRVNVAWGMNGNGNARNAGERMMVDPNQPRILLYGTRDRGLWRSEDYGATWRRVESFPTAGDTDRTPPTAEAGIAWVLFDRASGRRGAPTPTVYAGVVTRAARKLFRSADGGKSWEAMPGQPGADLLPQRAALAPDGMTLYLTFGVGQQYAGPFGIVGGAVYKVSGPATALPVWRDISPSKGHFGWSGIALDPTEPKTLYTSVLDRYNPPDDIYRSTDGGKSWTGLDVNDYRDDASAPYAKGMSTHWVGDVEIDPFDRSHALYTTGYGLYATTNLTAPHPRWVFFNEGLEQSAVLELVSPRSGSAHLLSGIGDRDGFRHEDFNISPIHGFFGESQKLGMSNTRDLAAAWDDPAVVVRAGYGAQYSLDGGLTWARFAPLAGTAEPTVRRRGRGGAVCVSADGKLAVYAAGGRAAYAMREGDGWTAWEPAGGATPQASLLADPVNPRRVYGLAGGEVVGSDDGGATWSRLSAAPGRINWLRPAFDREGHLWAACGEAGLFRSTDGGKTWATVGGDAIDAANQVGLGAAAPGRSYPAIYIGGMVRGKPGFFRSNDEGASWVRINDDQHQYGSITVVQGDPRVYGRIYLGCNGRGILYGEPARRR